MVVVAVAVRGTVVAVVVKGGVMVVVVKGAAVVGCFFGTEDSGGDQQTSRPTDEWTSAFADQQASKLTE